MKWLNNAIVQAFHSVQDCSPNVKAKTPEGWEQRIKKLASLARRNPKIFFRRAKADFLIPMEPSPVPVPIHQIEMIMNVHNPWDATAPSFMDEHEEKPIPVPTDEEIRQWARVSRCKAPGPVNVPRYLYYVLPDNVFHWVCDIVRAIIRGELRLDILRETVVFPLSKGNEDLSVSNAWRPISITSALYRIVFRCIQSYLETTLAPSLSGRQYAGRKGGSCAGATMDLQQLLGSKMMTGNGAYIAFVDVSNDFSSVQVPLLLDALLKYGVCAQVRDLFGYVLRHSVNYVYNTVTGKWDRFLATSGVKQGCATGPITFCAVMDLVIRELLELGVEPFVFMDHLAIVAETASELRHTLIHAQMLFARIGLSVNFAKTKMLPIRAQFNSESTVPARVYEGDQWRLCRNSLVRECIAQPQSDPTPVTIECVNSYLHLGHLIHTTWDPRCTHDELMSEFSQEIDVWNNRPLPVRAQLQVINSVLIPKIVYRLQCIQIVWDLLLKIQRWLKDFLLAIVGLPTFLCNKTLYSSHKFGLGLLHIPVVVATRMLDNVSNVLCKYGAHHLMHSEMGYLHILQSVVDALHAETSASVLPLGGTSDVQEVLNYSSFSDVEIQNWVWQYKHYIDTEHSAYSDGSFFESCNKCAGAAALEDGRTLCVRPPGYQSAYKAEVYGMFLACEYSFSCATIFTDCSAVLKAVKYRKERVVEARLIRLIGEHVDRKHMSLQYVRGHSGIPGNEEVDRRAKAAVNLPDAPVQSPVEVGDVSYHGELFTYPHKVSTRYHAIHRVLSRVGLSPKLAYPLPTTDQEVHQIRKLVCEILAAAAEDGKLLLQTARPTTGHASAPRRADTYTDTAHPTAQSPPMPLPSRCSPGDPHMPTIARTPGPCDTGLPHPPEHQHTPATHPPAGHPSPPPTLDNPHTPAERSPAPRGTPTPPSGPPTPPAHTPEDPGPPPPGP